MAYNFYKTPTQQELEALQLIKEKQNIQAQQNKQGFFDSLGVPSPAQPQVGPGQMQPFNPQQLQQMTAANMMNPNQLQGSANNAGLAIGSMLSKIFGPKQAPVDPVQAEDSLRAKAQLRVSQLVSQNTDPVDAWRQVSVELMKAGADTGNPTLTDMGTKLFDKYQIAAEKKASIEKFKPHNMMGPDGIMDTADTLEQEKVLLAKKYTFAGETPANPDVREVPIGTSVATQQLDRSTGKWVTNAIGQRAQLTGDLPKGIEAKRQDEYSHSIAAINGVLDLKESIIHNIDAAKIAGSAPGRAIVNAVGGILGTIKAIAPEISSNTMDPANYKEVLEKHRGVITASGATDAALIRLATMLAAQERFTDGEANKTSVADIKLKLESIGAHLGDPDTVKAILEEVGQGTVKDLGNKIDADLAFDTYKWAPGVRRRYKQLQDRISSIPDDVPDSVRDIINSHREKVNATN